MFEVGMPDAEAFESGSGRRLHPILEIERAVLAVGVRKACRDRPVRSQQLDDWCHFDCPRPRIDGPLKGLLISKTYGIANAMPRYETEFSVLS
jgi:hypothetical protein